MIKQLYYIFNHIFHMFFNYIHYKFYPNEYEQIRFEYYWDENKKEVITKVIR